MSLIRPSWLKFGSLNFSFKSLLLISFNKPNRLDTFTTRPFDLNNGKSAFEIPTVAAKFVSTTSFTKVSTGSLSSNLSI